MAIEAEAPLLRSLLPLLLRCQEGHTEDHQGCKQEEAECHVDKLLLHWCVRRMWGWKGK